MRGPDSLQLGEQLGNGFFQYRMDRAPGAISASGTRTKGRKCHPGMRHDRVRTAADKIAVEKEVEVQRARRVGGRALAAAEFLHLQQELKEFFRG